MLFSQQGPEMRYLIFIVDASISTDINDTYIMREVMNNIAVNWVLAM